MVRNKLPCSLNAVNNETSEVATKGRDSKALLGDLLVNQVTHVEHGIKISTSADQKEKKKNSQNCNLLFVNTEELFQFGKVLSVIISNNSVGLFGASR